MARPLEAINELLGEHLTEKHMEYKDKFAVSQEEAAGQNEKCLKDALNALYATYVTTETVSVHRGRAIQAINSMARALGYPHLVRND